MNLDTTKTIEAFENVADGMEYLTLEVHKYVLLSDWLETNGKAITKAIKSIADRNEELLVQTFIGKLCNKLPKLHVDPSLHEYDQERARKIAAALIASVLMDNGSYEVEKRVESTTSNNKKRFHTRLYLKLGGSYEKDLLRGIEDKPGVVNQKEVNGWKLNADQKAWLRKVASVPFCVSDVCTRELLMKGYSLKVDWDRKVDKNGRTLPEDPIVRKKRFGTYADTILEKVKTKPAFYLPMKYDSRGRQYYEAVRLDGIRPHGKLWETLMLDSAVSYELTEADERVLKHVIYVTLHDRVSIDEANEMFTVEDLLNADTIDPMEQTDEQSFGEAILLNKAAQALFDYQKGVSSRYMFGYDFTNSGLLMSGVSFRSEQMMVAGNIAGLPDVVDSHTAFGSGFDLDLDRKDVKSIHMGLLHGSSLKSIARTITEQVGTEISVEDVLAFTTKAYGEPVANIPLIADWGTIAVGNDQSTLRWTMPDGFSASSRAYLKGVPVQVYCASANHKDGYTSYVLVSDMPWVEDSNGFCVFGKEVEVGGHVYEVEHKKRGLFASLTHSIDAYMLRRIGDEQLSTGRPVLFKHDDYIVMPSDVTRIQNVANEVFQELFGTDLYQASLNEIAEHSPYDIEAPELKYGSGTVQQIADSSNFLMP